MRPGHTSCPWGAEFLGCGLESGARCPGRSPAPGPPWLPVGGSGRPGRREGGRRCLLEHHTRRVPTGSTVCPESALCLEVPVQGNCHALEGQLRGQCCAPRMEGSRVQCRIGIKKGPPCKLKFPEPQGVVEGLKKDLSKVWAEALALSCCPCRWGADNRTGRQACAGATFLPRRRAGSVVTPSPRRRGSPWAQPVYQKSQ